MSATTAVVECKEGRLGVMVRTTTEIFIYWRPGSLSGEPNLALRVTDLSGRPADQLLDGVGYRYLDAAAAVYVPNLQPGHLYFVEVGRRGVDGFHPLAGAGPVQTPWTAVKDQTSFPAPYHRS